MQICDNIIINYMLTNIFTFKLSMIDVNSNKDNKLKTHVLWIEENIDHYVQMDTEACEFFKQKFGCGLQPTQIIINGFFDSYTHFSISIKIIEKRKGKSNIINHLMLMQMGNIAIKDIMESIYIKFLCMILIVSDSNGKNMIKGVNLDNAYAQVISNMSKILKNPPNVNKIPIKSYVIDHIQEEEKNINKILDMLM